MSLKEYQRKRDFRRTAEPPAARGKPAGHRFVIQKHAASRLHYDLRLELDGVLKSWALPKGVPYEHAEKRLAVPVEDHPVAYIDFEGTIPSGQYGGGTVMVWDRGTYEPLSPSPRRDLERGKLHFVLRGTKLAGEWYLVRLREGEGWLLIRGGETMKPVSRKADDTSAASGQSMKQIARGDRVWTPAAKPVGKSPPLPAFVEPMKAKLAARPPAGTGWIYEIKFDGYRAIALRGGGESRLLSRNRKDLGGKYPEVMAAIARLGGRDAVVDGEIVALDEEGRSSFQRLQHYETEGEKPPLHYYVFDLLRLDGRDLRALPLAERKKALESILPAKDPVIRYSAGLGEDAVPLLEHARRLGLEGLIGKRANSVYESGARSGAWIKLKLLQEQEFVVGGYTDPEGSRGFLGALVVGVRRQGKLVCCGKVGTGFSHAQLRGLHACLCRITIEECPFANLPERAGGRWGQGITRPEMRRCHWVEPRVVCQIRFAEWTRDDHLRQPVFLGLREDKDPAEVTRERAR